MRAEREYKALISRIMQEGVLSYPSKGACVSVFNATIVVPAEHPPLLKSRKIYYKGIIGELKAFLNDENTVEGFKKHGCNFWGSWSNEDGTLDVDYARLLHNFNGTNQLHKLIYNLKNRPHSRKHVISLWNPSSNAKQVPCVMHYQWYVKDDILNMIWSQRSVDVMVGLASDMFSAWLFNQVIARHVGLNPGHVYMQLGDCHIYAEHEEGVRELMSREARGLSDAKFNIDATNLLDFTCEIIDYQHLAPLKFELKI